MRLYACATLCKGVAPTHCATMGPLVAVPLLLTTAETGCGDWQRSVVAPLIGSRAHEFLGGRGPSGLWRGASQLAQADRAACSRPVHLQLCAREHERDYQR